MRMADGRQGARRPDPPAARRRAAQARRQGLRVRARAAVRRRPADRSRTTSRSCATPASSTPNVAACGPTTTSCPEALRGAGRMAELSHRPRRARPCLERARAARDAPRAERPPRRATGVRCGTDAGCGRDRAAAAAPSDAGADFGAGLYAPATARRCPSTALLASLGCGNPTAVAELHEGETVLDLGSGGGIDVLLSARRVGPTGTRLRPRHDGRDARPRARATRPRPASTNVELAQGPHRGDPAPRRGRRRRASPTA